MPIRTMKSALLSTLVLSVALSAPGWAQSTPINAPDECRSYVVPKRLQPDWTIAADWISPRHLAVVDSIGGQVLHYTPEGKALGSQPEALARSISKSLDLKGFSPAAIRATPEGNRWIQLVSGDFVKLNGYQEILDSFALNGLSAGEERIIAGLYSWTIAGSDLLAFGNLKDAAGTWSTGFYRVSLSSPYKASVIEELPRYPEERVWYRLGFNYLTSLSRTGYGLRIDEANHRLWIVRIPSGKDELQRLEVDIRPLMSLPSLHDYTTPQEYVQLMKEVEESTMPIGLYGWEEDLYVVWRNQEAPGGQEWYLTKIDISPGQDPSSSVFRVVGHATLPTSANHLMAVPGPEYWAFIEKGTVEGFGIQNVERVQYVPAARIRSFAPNSRICE
jgi:hypothetical protein